MAETTKNDEPPHPRNPEAFREWLEKKPREWSVVIAARAALRLLPFAVSGVVKQRHAFAIILPVFRATAIARFAAIYPNRAIDPAARTASSAADEADAAVARAATRAARAAYAATTTDAARAAAVAVYIVAAKEAGVSEAGVTQAGDELVSAEAAGDTYAAIAVWHDALALNSRTQAEQLALAPLWKPGLGGTVFPSARLGEAWEGLRQDLHRLGRHWQIWTDWYDDVLAGSLPLPGQREEWEAAFTDVQDASYPWKGPLPWDDGPEAVNLAIKARLDSLQAAEGASAVPDQSPAPVRVEERNGKIARVHDRDSPLRAAERDFNAWREPVIDHIEELTSGDFREGTNHSRARDRLVALGDLLPGDIADVKEQQFRIGYEIERFEGLIAAYRSGGDDMPVLTAASLEDLDRLRIALKMGIDKLERWAEFRRLAADDPRREGDANPEAVGGALDQMAQKMECQPKYFDPALPASFRFLAEAAKDKIGATKTVVYGAVKSAENLISFLGQRALGIGKNAIEGVEKHISKAVATTLLIGLGGAALKLSSALPQSWAWLKPLLEALSKVDGG